MSGSSDEEGKSMKNSDTEEQDKKTDTEEEVQEEGDVQRQEEEETDTEAAADTEVSDKLVVLSSGEENDDLPSKKQKYASLNKLSHVKSGPDPRHSSRHDKNEADQSSSTEPQGIFADFKKENFLFEVQLSPIDYQKKTLTIPWETVEKYFHAADTGSQSEINVTFFSKYNVKSPLMKLLISPQPGAHMVEITGWSQFFAAQNLNAKDLIRFYKPLYLLPENEHYLLDSLNFLFMKKLVATDITENKLHILKKEAEEHFRALNTFKISEVEIEISDAENETYNMKLLVYPKTGTNSDAYKITWKSFVEKHKLEVDDEISFYKPGRPMKGNHYAIRFEKKKKEQT
ncbi:uncharacterized protein LOC114265610 [Camellia sinensis]|uniref:uncharacterized protein LOC114265610 n=1 Tax=Camellia sinensis TaxID=4442 RepID=UPI001036D21F|nr:uncharacterized protein LOC114265610 [Camellia sinensis]